MHGEKILTAKKHRNLPAVAPPIPSTFTEKLYTHQLSTPPRSMAHVPKDKEQSNEEEEEESEEQGNVGDEWVKVLYDYSSVVRLWLSVAFSW